MRSYLSTYFWGSEVLEDKKFILSVCVSLIGVIGISYGVVRFLQEGRISADLISNVTFLNASDTSKIADAKPISELLANPQINTVYAAYVANFRDLCAKGDITTAPKDSVILLQGTQTVSASAATLTPQYCGIAQRHGGNENILVTSDVPFKGIPSERMYVATEPRSSFLLRR